MAALRLAMAPNAVNQVPGSVYDGPVNTVFFARDQPAQGPCAGREKPGKKRRGGGLEPTGFDNHNAILAGFTRKRLGCACRLHGKMRTRRTSVSHCMHGLYGDDPFTWFTALGGMPTAVRVGMFGRPIRLRRGHRLLVGQSVLCH